MAKVYKLIVLRCLDCPDHSTVLAEKPRAGGRATKKNHVCLDERRKMEDFEADNFPAWCSLESK
jgi:hypothetical protein